jgi:GntR family transcriptional regulator
MADVSVDPNKSVKRPFQRLLRDLAAIIQATPAGEKLPSETALTVTLGVSRSTLREAIRSFEGQGLIRRRQGVGTFVVSPTRVIETGLEVLESIETLAARIQLAVTMGDLDVREYAAGEDQAATLEVSPGTRLIQVSRVLLADDRPVAYLEDLLPQDVLSPQDLNVGFTGSVLDLLLTRGDPPLASSRTEICAVAAPPEIARALQIQRGDVLLLLEACLTTPAGRVVDYSHSYSLPGYFRFHVNRTIGKTQAAALRQAV